MTHKIIETDNYLLVVDDSEIKEGDYRINIQRGYVKLVEEADDYYNQRGDVFKKVIAHLPLNSSPILEGIDLLPPLEQEDDVEKISEREFPYLYQPMKGLDTTLLLREGFIEGYNKAKEKYKWTDEDLRMAIKMAQILKFNEGKYAGIFYNSNEIIQFLSQPKYPIAFRQGNEVDNKTYTSVTRRHDGLTLWIGKYIY